MSNENNYIIMRMRQLMAERNWTIYKLAKESKLPYSSLNNIFVRETIPSVYTLERICNGFQITLSQFFNSDESVISSQDMLNSDERVLINQFRKLNKDEKKLAQAFLGGLCKQLPDITE